MTDRSRSHLNSIELRLSHERDRLSYWKEQAALGRNKVRAAREITFRTYEIASVEKERQSELKFLGITEEPEADLSLDEIAELLGL